MAAAYFRKRLKASVTNRYLWERFGHNSYTMIMDRIHQAPSSLGFLRSFHNFNGLQRLLYPQARRFLKQRYGKLVD